MRAVVAQMQLKPLLPFAPPVFTHTLSSCTTLKDEKEKKESKKSSRKTVGSSSSPLPSSFFPLSFLRCGAFSVMQAQQSGQRRGSGLLRQAQTALRRVQPTLNVVRAYFHEGLSVVSRWAWVSSFATWVIVYPLLRGRQHQQQLDAAYRSVAANRNALRAEGRASHYQHQ